MVGAERISSPRRGHAPRALTLFHLSAIEKVKSHMCIRHLSIMRCIRRIGQARVDDDEVSSRIQLSDDAVQPRDAA